MVPGGPYQQILDRLRNPEPEDEPPSVPLDEVTLKLARDAARPPWYASGWTGIIAIAGPILLWLDGSFAGQGTSIWTIAITGLYPVCGGLFIVLPWLVFFLVHQSRTFYLKRAIELRKAWVLTGPIQVVAPKTIVIGDRRIDAVQTLLLPQNAAAVQWTVMFADGRLHPADSGRVDKAVAVAIFGPNGERVYPAPAAAPLLFRAPAVIASLLLSIALSAGCNAQSQTYADAATRLSEIKSATPCTTDSKRFDDCMRWVQGTVTWDGGEAISSSSSVCSAVLRWDAGQQQGDIRVDYGACAGLSADAPVPAQIELVKNYAIQVRVGSYAYLTDLNPPNGDMVFWLAPIFRLATILWLAWPLLHVVATVVYRLRLRATPRAGTPSPQAPAVGSTS